MAKKPHGYDLLVKATATMPPRLAHTAAQDWLRMCNPYLRKLYTPAVNAFCEKLDKTEG